MCPKLIFEYYDILTPSIYCELPTAKSITDTIPRGPKKTFFNKVIRQAIGFIVWGEIILLLQK